MKLGQFGYIQQTSDRLAVTNKQLCTISYANMF